MPTALDYNNIDFETGVDTSVDTSSDGGTDYEEFIKEAAEKYNVEPEFIKAIIKVESGGDPKALSNKKAQGLMQLIPETAKEMGVEDVTDPRQNIMGGTKYISQQLESSGGDKKIALAKYNAGPANVKKHGGMPPFPETINYADSVLTEYKKLKGKGYDIESPKQKKAGFDYDNPDFEPPDESVDFADEFDFEGDTPKTFKPPAPEPPVPQYAYDLSPVDMPPEGSDLPELLGGALESKPAEAALEKVMTPVNKQLMKGVNILDDTKKVIKEKAKELMTDQDVVEPGNIDLRNRPIVQNPDGTISTEKSISFGTDRGEVLIPTIIKGVPVSNFEAFKHYIDTGEHLGIYKDANTANKYAEMIHNRFAEPDYAGLGLPVGEPEMLGAVLAAPFKPGGFLAEIPGQVTEADLAQGQFKKEGSPEELGGELLGTAAEFFHNLPGPKKVYYKDGELKPGELGRQIGKIMTKTGFEMAGATGIFRALGVGAETVLNSDLWKSIGKGFSNFERRVGLQTAADMANEMKAAGASDAEVLKALRKYTGKDRKKVFDEYFKKTQAGDRAAAEGKTREFFKGEAERAKNSVLKGDRKLLEAPKPKEKPVPEKAPEPAKTGEIGAKPPEVKTKLGKEVAAEIKETKKPSPLAQLTEKEKKISETPKAKPLELMAPEEKETAGKAIAKKFNVEYKGYWKDMKKEMFNMDVGGGRVETFYAKDLNEDTVRKAVEATKKKWGISDRRLEVGAPKVERRVGERRDVALRKAVEEMSPEEKEYVIPELRRANVEKLKEIAKLKKEINTDPLTGLRNRKGITKVIDRAEQSGKDSHYTFIDLVGFKGLNDNVGYSAGDKALEHIGAAMKKLGLKGARTGGDEFGIVSATPEKAQENVAKLRKYFAENKVRVKDKAGKEFDVEVLFRDGTAKIDYAGEDVPAKVKAAQDLAESKKATEPKEWKRGEAHPGLIPVEPKAEAPKWPEKETKDLRAVFADYLDTLNLEERQAVLKQIQEKELFSKESGRKITARLVLDQAHDAVQDALRNAPDAELLKMRKNAFKEKYGHTDNPLSPKLEVKVKPKRVMKDITYTSYKGDQQLKGKSYLEYKGMKIAKQHKGLFNIVDKDGKAVGQYAGVNGAMKAIDEGKYGHVVIPKEKVVPKKGENIRTLRGWVKHMGKINPLNFKGEVKELPKTAQFLFKSDGVPIDDAVRQLVDEGFLAKDTDVGAFLEELRTNKDILKQDRVFTGQTTEKPEAELTEKEKRYKKEEAFEPEEPPDGDYVTMSAGDLPEGKKLTIIESKTAHGWDIYEVKEAEPFGPVKLVDGQEITLKPGDKVQVLKADLKKPAKEKIEVISKDGKYVDWNEIKVRKQQGIEQKYYGTHNKDKSFLGWKTKSEIERMQSATAKGKEAIKLDQGTYGAQKPAGMKKGVKAEQQGLGLNVKEEPGALFTGKSGTVLYSGVPIHELANTSKALGRLYEKHIGSPLWKFLSETVPVGAGKKMKIVDMINKGIILDYRKAPAWIKLRDETFKEIELARKMANRLALKIKKLPRAEQVRYSQIIQGSITSLNERYKDAYDIMDKFKYLEGQLQRLGILGPDNIFRQLTRKELAKKFKDVKALDKKIEQFKKRLEPIIRRGKVIKRSSEKTFEQVKDTITKTKTGKYKTDATKWTKLNEDRIREALTSRGFSMGEADQMIERVKQSVVEIEGTEFGTLKEIHTTVEKVVTKTITHEVERIKTFSRSYMARAKASILKDIKELVKKRNEIMQRISVHYKMSGKHYLRRAYKSIETEENFLSRLMGYATKRPRLKKGYNIQRKDLDHLYRTYLGEIKEAPYLVYKGLSEEYHDMFLMEMFNRVSENKKWAVSPKEWDNIMRIKARADKVAFYKDFKPLPMSDKLGPLSGAMVDQYIWDDLNETVKTVTAAGKAYDKLLNLWKIGKVPYNPATQVRNIGSNVILADFGGLSPLRIDIYARAARDLLTKSGYWEEADTETVLFGKEWAGGEVEKFLGYVQDLKDGNFFEKTAGAVKFLANKPLEVYQGIEQFFKLAVYTYHREAGLSIDEAAKIAEDSIFNYQKIPPAIRWAKRWYSPFITFSYKAVPRFAETAIKKPWKIAKYGILMAAVEEWTRRMYGESKEEVEREKHVLPDYMRKAILPGQLAHLRIPYKDQYNRSKYLDLSFILPWGDVAEQWGQSRFAGRPFLPSHPLWITMAEIGFNEIMFTGQDLTVKDIDEGSDYWKKIGKQIWRQAAPSLVGSYGFNKLMSAYKGELDWALRDRSVTEAIFDVFLGLKVRSIDYTEERARRMRYYRGKIDEIKQRFDDEYTKIFIRNTQPNPEKDNERFVKLSEKTDKAIQRIMDKITEIEK